MKIRRDEREVVPSISSDQLRKIDSDFPGERAVRELCKRVLAYLTFRTWSFEIPFANRVTSNYITCQREQAKEKQRERERHTRGERRIFGLFLKNGDCAQFLQRERHVSRCKGILAREDRNVKYSKHAYMTAKTRSFHQFLFILRNFSYNCVSCVSQISISLSLSRVTQFTRAKIYLI